MVDASRLQKQVREHTRAIAGTEDAPRREALRALRSLSAAEWAEVPDDVTRSLVLALSGQLLEKGKPFGQRDVAVILGDIGPRSKEAVPQLIELMRRNAANSIRETVVETLGRIGKPAQAALDDLIQLLPDSRAALSVHIVRALGNIGCADARVRDLLLNLWQTQTRFESPQAQLAISLCQLRLGAAGLLETVTKVLVTHQETRLRKAAAEALFWCDKNQPEVVPALLVASLADTNEDVRNAAQAALDQMHLEAGEALRICSRQLGPSAFAETALRKSGADAIPELIAALATPSSDVRVKAARTLGACGESANEAVAKLQKTLRDKDPHVRLAAAKALWGITKTADVAVPALVGLLKMEPAAEPEALEARRQFLQSVMEALSRMGPAAKTAVPALAALTRDSNRHIRESASAAVQRISPAAAK